MQALTLGMEASGFSVTVQVLFAMMGVERDTPAFAGTDSRVDSGSPDGGVQCDVMLKAGGVATPSVLTTFLSTVRWPVGDRTTPQQAVAW